MHGGNPLVTVKADQVRVQSRLTRGQLVKHPGFDAHLPRWEGCTHVKQVRRGDQGPGRPVGA